MKNTEPFCAGDWVSVQLQPDGYSPGDIVVYESFPFLYAAHRVADMPSSNATHTWISRADEADDDPVVLLANADILGIITDQPFGMYAILVYTSTIIIEVAITLFRSTVEGYGIGVMCFAWCLFASLQSEERQSVDNPPETVALQSTNLPL